MPAGIQVRDPTTGALIFDINDINGRLLGMVEITNVAGNIYDADFATGAGWAVFAPYSTVYWNFPDPYVSGNYVYWGESFTGGPSAIGILFYGVGMKS